MGRPILRVEQNGQEVSSVVQTLRELFTQYGSDKASLGYGEVYETYFAPMVTDKVTLLELGVYSGASLRAWKDYFPYGTIAGLDSDTFPEVENVVVHRGRQNDKELLESLANEYKGFDIVVDDCSHQWEDQQASWEALWKHIRPGGYYVIEDLGTSLDPTPDRWHRDPAAIDTLEYLSHIMRQVIGDHMLVGSMEFMHFYPNICLMKKRIR